jgi:hypothetical protein
VNDLFKNYVEPANDGIGYAEFTTSFTNLNMTTEPSVPDEGYIHIGEGKYKFNATLFKRGNYRLDIRLKDVDGKFKGISGSPFYLEV